MYAFKYPFFEGLHAFSSFYVQAHMPLKKMIRYIAKVLIHFTILLAYENIWLHVCIFQICLANILNCFKGNIS